MEYTRNLVLLTGLFVSLSVQSNDINPCLTITNSSERLACYDRAHGYQNENRDQLLSEGVTVDAPEKAKIRAVEKPIAKKVIVTAAQNAYDRVIANSLTMKVVKVVTTKRKKVYYYTDTGRVFRKNTDRTVTFRINDQVKIEKGFLQAQFLKNQDGTKIKVKEVNR
ncbi:hypothetical protein OAK26_04000 [Gammaproteobacteria bacterium]|nr:hypothetical protein [Gammaproteobacteria bacterium]